MDRFFYQLMQRSNFGTIIKVTVPILALATILEFVYSFFIIKIEETRQKVGFTLHE